MKVQTVTIESNGAPLVINKCDFDPDTHELWDARETPEAASEETPEAASEETDGDVENDVVCEHKGGGHWTVTVNGQAVHEGTLKKAEAKALAAEY